MNNGYRKIELYQEAIKFERLDDYREAFNLYLASAKQGYAKSQLAVAKFYLGDGIYKGIIKPDRAKAIYYLDQAGSGGNAEAKYRLALILLQNNTKADIAQAMELLQDASDRQYLPAAYELSKCSYYGIGCKKSYAKTLEILEKLIYLKNAYSQIDSFDDIKKMLKELKVMASEHKNSAGLSGDDLCLLNDLCNDLNVGND